MKVTGVYIYIALCRITFTWWLIQEQQVYQKLSGDLKDAYQAGGDKTEMDKVYGKKDILIISFAR